MCNTVWNFCSFFTSSLAFLFNNPKPSISLFQHSLKTCKVPSSEHHDGLIDLSYSLSSTLKMMNCPPRKALFGNAFHRSLKISLYIHFCQKRHVLKSSRTSVDSCGRKTFYIAFSNFSIFPVFAD